MAQQDPPPGVVIEGELTAKDARAYVKRVVPKWAPQGLLLDNRADFYKVRKLRVGKALRVDEAQVDVDYRLVMRADKAHAKQGWFAIRCKGVMRAARLSDGGLGGAAQDYTCRTVFPKTG